MYKYVIRRILLIIPILLFVIFIVFVILNITPGDPATIILGRDAPQAARDQLTIELGLDKPVLERYVLYVINAAQLDFGESYRSGTPVFQDILYKFPTTLKLAIFSVIFSTIIGIPLGILSAVKQYSTLDIGLTVSSLFLASIPGFWFGMLLILFLSLSLRLLPSSGIGSWKHLVMPVMTLALPTAAYLARLTRTTMVETMREDYIRTAKAKGASKQRIIWKHALQNALMPVITVVGMSFAGLLGGAMITEIVFGLPGIGNAIVLAIKMKDIPIVMASTIFLATLFMLIMLAVDLLYAFLDPRIKAQFK
jgi:peptide/nickel transport system permease protein